MSDHLTDWKAKRRIAELEAELAESERQTRAQLDRVMKRDRRIAELEHRLDIWSIAHSDEINQLQADKEDLERTIEEAIDFLRNDAYRTRVINALMILEAER